MHLLFEILCKSAKWNLKLPRHQNLPVVVICKEGQKTWVSVLNCSVSRPLSTVCVPKRGFRGLPPEGASRRQAQRRGACEPGASQPASSGRALQKEDQCHFPVLVGPGDSQGLDCAPADNRGSFLFPFFPL